MPSREERLRKNVRLRLDEGHVVLRYGGVPAVRCALLDLSEGGCQALVPLATEGNETAISWKQILSVDREVGLLVTCPPHLDQFPLLAQVRNITDRSHGEVCVGLQFIRLTDDQVRMLSRVMLNFATGKIRDRYSSDQAMPPPPHSQIAGARSDGTAPGSLDNLMAEADQKKDPAFDSDLMEIEAVDAPVQAPPPSPPGNDPVPVPPPVIGKLDYSNDDPATPEPFVPPDLTNWSPPVPADDQLEDVPTDLEEIHPEVPPPPPPGPGPNVAPGLIPMAELNRAPDEPPGGRQPVPGFDVSNRLPGHESINQTRPSLPDSELIQRPPPPPTKTQYMRMKNRRLAMEAEKAGKQLDERASEEEQFLADRQREPLPAPPPPAGAAVPPRGTGGTPPHGVDQGARITPPGFVATPTPRPASGAVPRDGFRGRRIGEVLVMMGKLREEQVGVALKGSKRAAERLGRYLLREGMVQPDELCRALALQSGLPMTDLTGVKISPDLIKLLEFDTMAKYTLLPFDEAPRMLCVAAANPVPPDVITQLERQCERHIEVFLAQEDLLLRELDKVRPNDTKTNRRYMRYRFSMPVAYQFCNRLGRVVEEVVHVGETSDISEGGFSIEGPAPNLGEPDTLRRRGLCLNLTLEVNPDPIKCLCAIRFVKVLPDEERRNFPWVFGLQILELKDADRRRLKDLCIRAGKPDGSSPRNNIPRPRSFD